MAEHAKHPAIEQRGQRIADAIEYLAALTAEASISLDSPHHAASVALVKRHLAALFDGVPVADLPALDKGQCDGCMAGGDEGYSDGRGIDLLSAGGASGVMLCRDCIHAAMSATLETSP